MNAKELKRNIYLVDNFWTPERCDDFITRTETVGYAPGTIQTENGPRLVDHIRNNNRVMYKDLALAKDIWQQLEQHAPSEMGESVAIGL